MNAHVDMTAFRRKLASGAAYECREAPTPDLKAIAETVDKTARAFEEFKAANDAALAEAKKSGVTPETRAKLDNLDAELDRLSGLKADLEKVLTKASRPGAFGNGGELSKPEQDYKSAFFDWMRDPKNPEMHTKMKQAEAALPPEVRAAQVVTGTGSAGGFALPEIIERQIARLTADISPIRQIATVRTVGSSDYKELFDVGGAAGEWVGETGTRSQTNTPDLAEVAPTMGTLSARPRATEESLDDLFFDVESWLQASVAETFAVTENAAFTSGNGTNRPTGFLAGPTPVLTGDATRAFGTLQCIVSGQAAALPTSPDTYLDMVYALRARYRANARWVSNRTVLAALRKIKDTTGQYLWQPSMSAGQPETFMGYQVTEAEEMPNVGAGAFPLAFGDFREGYLVVDRVGTRITRDEITLPGFVQWYVRKRVGGRIRNSQAIKLLRISAT